MHGRGSAGLFRLKHDLRVFRKSLFVFLAAVMKLHTKLHLFFVSRLPTIEKRSDIGRKKESGSFFDQGIGFIPGDFGIVIL